MKYSHIVFDIDNTLIDTTNAVLHSLQKALREVTGEHWDTEKLRPALGIPGLKAFEALGIQSPEQIFRIYPLWNQYLQSSHDAFSLYDGILPLLTHLKAQGRTLGIITSMTATECIDCLSSFSIEGFFQTLITAEDTFHHKPGPQPLNAYIWLADADASQTLYVGDDLCDMECAKAAGVDGALALWGCQHPQGISSQRRFASPTELLEQIKNGTI